MTDSPSWSLPFLSSLTRLPSFLDSSPLNLEVVRLYRSPPPTPGLLPPLHESLFGLLSPQSETATIWLRFVFFLLDSRSSPVLQQFFFGGDPPYEATFFRLYPLHLVRFRGTSRHSSQPVRCWGSLIPFIFPLPTYSFPFLS